MWAVFAVKLVLTVAVLVYLFTTRVQVRDLMAVLDRVSLGVVGLALTLWLAGDLLRTWRWQIMLRLFDLQYRYARLLPIFLIGAFFGSFTPGTLGADAARTIWTRREQPAPYGLIIGSILLERAAGLLALMVIFALVSFLYSFEVYGIPFAWLATGLLSLFGLGVAFLSAPRLTALLRRGLSKLPGKKLAEEIDLLLAAIHALRWRPAALAGLLMISFTHQFSIIVINWVLARGLDIPVRFGHLCLFIPAIVMVASLPATINGIGIREAAYMALFKAVDIAPAESVSLSLLFFLVVTLGSALGGLVFVFYRQRRPRTQVE